MIRIDLSLPPSSRGLTGLQFLLLFFGILLSVAIIVGLVLILQWNSLKELGSEVKDLQKREDSLQTLVTQVRAYQQVQSDYQGFITRFKDSPPRVDKRMNVLKELQQGLEPGMEFLSAGIESDTVTAYCLSPSNVKVARYVEQLNRTGLVEFLESQPQGTSRGLIKHRVLLRMR